MMENVAQLMNCGERACYASFCTIVEFQESKGCIDINIKKCVLWNLKRLVVAK